MTTTSPSSTHPTLLYVESPDSSSKASFSTRIRSVINLPPHAVFAELAFPPCVLAPQPTYATVQIDREKHVDLNSDLMYLNHSCEPSLMLDTAAMKVIVGPDGLGKNDELTFFYPSTEWEMVQSFNCHCGKPTCRGRISGAKDMTSEQLKGQFLNKHIREQREEQQHAV